MNPKVLSEILLKNGAVREGDRIAVTDDITLFVAVGEQTITIDKIAFIELMHDLIIAITRRNDRYVMLYEDLRMLRMGAEQRESKKAGLLG